jgi:DNA helicase-2/ATP-dependent DNA helicase PcrA
MKDDLVLNEKQKEAVEFRQGPLLIVAGAGTGKTTVITERIKFLIRSEAATPAQILALTFTEKAAREMEERIDIAMPYGYTQMWISTFHGFSDRILRQEALQIGLDPKYKLLTQAETIQFIRNHLFEFELDYYRPLGNPTKFVEGMLQHFSRLQDEDIGPHEYLKFTGQRKTKKRKSKEEKMEARKTLELAKAYQEYQRLKVKEGFMDFGDLIGNTLELFRKRPNILRMYRRQFKHMLVDEFQDTNIAQNELIKLLAGKQGNIAVVADDDQSIYKWRGAAVSNVIQFRKSFPKSKIITLTRNYRSAQEILDKAYELIQHNNPDRLEVLEKIDKKLIAQRNIIGQLQFIHKDRVENESEEVAKTILQLTSNGEYDYKDIAILVRANNHSEPFVRALLRQRIPYQFLGPGRLFKQPEIIDLIAYLKVLYNFEDSVSMYRLLSIEELGIPAKDIIRISNFAKKMSRSVFEACEHIDDILVSEETKKKIKRLMSIIEKHLGLMKRETTGQLLYYFLEDSGLLPKLLNPESAEAEKKATNISKLFDKLKTYEADHEDASVTAVVDWIELMSELGESPLAADTDWTAVNAVNILTIHSAKGLEFPVVFLVNLVSQRFPTIERREQIPIPEELIKEVLPEGDYHEQEERRLFYVGVTRARDRLIFTAADYYGEGKRTKKLSPFIFESLGDAAAAAEQPTSDHQLSFVDYASPHQPPTTSHQPPVHHIDYLSYSQIETFKTCPLHYKLKYIFKIPTPPSASQSFGTSIHAALKEAYRYALDGRRLTVKQATRFLKDNWITEGYSGRSHEQKMFEKGQRYLIHFIKQEYDPKSLPVALERSFVVPLKIPKNERPLKIGGKMDRIDRIEGEKLNIIDYKTGANVPTQKEIDHNLQLSIYAIAANRVREYPFNRTPQDIVLSLYYFDTEQWMTSTRTEAQLANAIREIDDWRAKIETSDFSCSGNPFCDHCEYALFCRAERESNSKRESQA